MRGEKIDVKVKIEEVLTYLEWFKHESFLVSTEGRARYILKRWRSNDLEKYGTIENKKVQNLVEEIKENIEEIHNDYPDL